MPDPIIKPFVGPTFYDRQTGRTFTWFAHNDIARLTMRLGDSDPVEILRVGKDGVLKFISTAAQGVDSLILTNERTDSQSSVFFDSDTADWVMAAVGSTNPIVTAGGYPVANCFIIVQKAGDAGPGRFPLIITPDGLWRINSPIGLSINGTSPLQGMITHQYLLDFGTVAANDTELLTRSMPGVRQDDNFLVTPSDWQTGLVNAACYNPDIVTIAFRNPDNNAAHTPAARTYRVTAFQFPADPPTLPIEPH